jgi:glutamine amidotransferase
MCRHAAYLGPPASLRSLLIDPPYSLYRQAWAPRRQRYGTVNADGFGIGWYAPGDPVPARYRRGEPIWADESLPDIARVTRSGAVLAAVRSATAGMAAGPQAAAPFAAGPWLFSHNGVAPGWRDWAGRAAALARPALAEPTLGQPGPGAQPSNAAENAAADWPALLSSLEALVDSAFLWTLALTRLRAGSAPGDALGATIAAVTAAGGTGRFNFLLTDGHSVAATACGDTLCYRRADGAVTVASEPSDDEPGWTEVPDQHLLTATPAGVTVEPLTGPASSRPAHRNPVSERTGGDVFPEGIVTA